MTDDITPESYAPRNVDLISCLLTSKALHAAVLSVLYKNVTIPHSITFSKVLGHLSRYPALGTLVRRLDFSHYTSIGFGRTRQASSEIQNVTPKTLQKFLGLTTSLKEFQVHELIEDELDTDVLEKLFAMPSIQALDFCACMSDRFTIAFTTILTDSVLSADVTSYLPSLRRLSLHECSTLQAPLFEALLPRLISLTHLDVAHTMITSKALVSIPQSARLTHLNLGKCTRSTGRRLDHFLTTHNAIKDTIVYLNLMADASSYRLLSESDLEDLLPGLPKTLRSLNIGGAEITTKTMSMLYPLTKFLEELDIAHARVTKTDIDRTFEPDPGQEEAWVPSSLRYINIVGIAEVRVHHLMNGVGIITRSESLPLEVIEVDQKNNGASTQISWAAPGENWVRRELGRRAWYVRQPDPNEKRTLDSGRRSWKMGARWWGMRKVSMAVQEVGGMYGYYMFKN